MESTDNGIVNPAQGAVIPAEVSLDLALGRMTGGAVSESTKTLGALAKIFHDRDAFAAMDPGGVVYRVRWWAPVNPGSEGGLFWGVTVLEPGKVGDEYFMTHGHFHANPTRAEYYATVSGRGMLIRMDAERRTWGEAMAPGSVHYIRGAHAHRVANTGTEPLIFWACWGSDAGYNYATIAERGFGARLVERDGQPVLVAAE
ncbi:MAG TPA: glucose-6-phosphate isomerase family protein [Acidobacteriaceae bacterium]|jgi:glucose-6-phosphate isomerase|nr:glucose-6-phosphate isomerase family protein [Acidobacteriaceae bacterium]